jgi:ribulose-phosphate 3-epimerase
MNIKKEIIPAVIAKNQKELEDKINKVANFVNIIQLDFMDGEFVPNNSIDFDFDLPKVNCKFEAHLMIKNPKEWIEKNYYKVDIILVHFESINNPNELIGLGNEKNKSIGFVLNPETSINEIKDYINRIDQVLIMAVNPGFYGSPFLPEVLYKISELRELKNDLDIEVDGGITDKTIELVNKAGANLFVSGSFIIKSNNVEKSINKLKQLIK